MVLPMSSRTENSGRRSDEKKYKRQWGTSIKQLVRNAKAIEKSDLVQRKNKNSTDKEEKIKMGGLARFEI